MILLLLVSYTRIIYCHNARRRQDKLRHSFFRKREERIVNFIFCKTIIDNRQIVSNEIKIMNKFNLENFTRKKK